MTLWLFIVLGIVLLVAALSTTSIRDLLESKVVTGPAPAASPVAAPATPVAAPAATPIAAPASPAPVSMKATAPPAEFGIDQLRELFSVLSEKERARVLADEAAFSDMVRKEHARWAILQAAREAGLETSSQVAYLMQRSAEQVLVDTYVKLNVGAAVPATFPSEDQIRQFYEQNRSRYRVEPRIPVWQIFLAIPDAAGAAQITEVERLAKGLVSSLRAGKLEFAKAASEHSAHEASRLNGGFMGNLKVGDLIPEVKSAVSEAQIGKVLDPVRSPSGLHILKRGEQIEATQLTLDQAHDRIKSTLRQAAETKAQQLLVSHIQEKAGDEPGDGQLENWRAALSATAGTP